MAIGLILAIVFILYLKHRQKETGKEQRSFLYPLLLFIVFAIITYFILPEKALYKDVPVLGKYNISGGLHITAEWFSLFSGLVLYTSGFIAEIFRSGIQGVSNGQIEAARALGLSHMQTVRLVVIPQAKVVIIPPLTSQFLGVAKNTSLGVAIGFPDMFAITGTIMNQTGRTLEMILLIMSIYLTLSLITSFFMNQYNKKVQLKER
jgi:general L-amino acid transport system permease protein